MQGLITLTLGSTPPGWCYSGDPAVYAAELVNAITVNYNNQVGNYLYNVGDTEPTVDNRIYPWFRTDSVDGYDGWYYWSTTYSGWIKPHDVPASGKARILWVGTDVELQTYDGGSAAAVTPSTGPFWEIDTDFDAKIPMGPGTTAGGTVVAVGVDAGSDEATLVEANIPEHTHFVANSDHKTSAQPLVTATNQVIRSVDNAGDEEYALMGSSTAASVGLTSAYGQAAPDPVTTIGPVRGCYVIKRTARVYRII